MLLSPQEYIPVEVAMRTTQARQAFRAQPRRTVRPSRLLRAARMLPSRLRRRRRHTLAA